MKHISKLQKQIAGAILFFSLIFNAGAQPLSGNYTIGLGGNFANFAAAIASLNTSGVAAPGATFNVLPGLYNESPLIINIASNLPGATNPLVFQGAGSTPTLNCL